MTKQTKKTKEAQAPEVKKATHRQWLYKGENKKIFEEGDIIPVGYSDKPSDK